MAMERKKWSGVTVVVTEDLNFENETVAPVRNDFHEKKFIEKTTLIKVSLIRNHFHHKSH